MEETENDKMGLEVGLDGAGKADLENSGNIALSQPYQNKDDYYASKLDLEQAVAYQSLELKREVWAGGLQCLGLEKITSERV